MNKIKNVSLFFKVVFQIIFFLLPILFVMSWYYAPQELNLLIGIIRINAIPISYQNDVLHELSQSERIFGGLVGVIPLIIQMLVLYFLIKLFKLYEKGEIFSLRHVKYIRNIGYTLFAGQLIEPFYQGIMGVILTLHNPPHHRFVTITLDQTNIGMLLTALLVILISWIMAEGYKLREEQQFTI